MLGFEYKFKFIMNKLYNTYNIDFYTINLFSNRGKNRGKKIKDRGNTIPLSFLVFFENMY
jgi:hypothetical protein